MISQLVFCLRFVSFGKFTAAGTVGEKEVFCSLELPPSDLTVNFSFEVCFLWEVSYRW